MTVTLNDGFVVDFSKDGVPKMDDRFISNPLSETPPEDAEEYVPEEIRDFFAENPEKTYIRKPDGSVEEMKTTIIGYGETPQPGNIVVSNFEQPVKNNDSTVGQMIINDRVHTTGYVQPTVGVPLSGLPDDYLMPSMQVGHYQVTQAYPTDVPVKGYFPSEIETTIKTKLNILKGIHKKISVTRDDENTLLVRLVADHANMSGYIEALEYVIELFEGKI